MGYNHGQSLSAIQPFNIGADVIGSGLAPPSVNQLNAHSVELKASQKSTIISKKASAHLGSSEHYLQQDL